MRVPGVRMSVRRTASRAILSAILVALLLSVLEGWFLMLALAVTHARVLSAVQPPSLITSWLLVVLFKLAFKSGSEQ